MICCETALNEEFIFEDSEKSCKGASKLQVPEVPKMTKVTKVTKVNEFYHFYKRYSAAIP